jgi:hypothetical protein
MAEPTKEQKQQIEDLIKLTGKTGIKIADIQNLEQANAIIKGLRAELKDMSSDLGYIRDAFKDSVAELSKQNTYLSASKSALKSISSISSQVLEHKKGESALSIDQLKKLQHKGKLQFEELNLAIKRGKLLKDQKFELLTAVAEQEMFNKELNKAISIEERINKEIGLVGTGLQGLAKFMNQLGFADLSQPFKEAIEQTKNAKRGIIDNKSQIEEINKKLKTRGKLSKEERAELKLTKKSLEANSRELQGQTSKYKNILSAVGKQLTSTNLLDFAIKKIIEGFFNVNKASVEFQRITGQNVVAVGSMNTRFATTVDFLKTASELTQQIGFNAVSIFGPGQLAAVAEAKNLLGLSAEEAGNLALQSKGAGQTIDSFQDSLLAGVDATNRLRKSVVAPGIVLKDVLNTSKGISLSLGNNPERLGKAATAARAFGMELKQVDSIASSLLNFESSIEAELEAQLLTGKEINLAKAREYAMTNNLAGLSEELAKNGATAAEFANMNRFAQESLAKAVGMSRDDLAKSIMLQESSKNLSDEQRAAVLGVTKEQLQQVDIQERLGKSVDKLAQAFAPILGIMEPVVDLLGQALDLVALITYPFSYLFEVAGKLGQSISSMLGPLGVMLKVVKGIALAAVITAAYKTYAAVSTALAATIVGGIAAPIIGGAAAAAILAAGGGFLGSIKDGVIDPKKGPVVSGDFGTVQLNPKDQIVAGTNLYGGDSTAGGSSMPSISMQPLIAEIQSMKQELKAVLITIANKEGSVYLDTDLVGKALVLGSTRM